MSRRDYYEVLGVDKTATQEDIKKAYRKKAMEYHPDRNPGNKQAEDRFKEATEAYEVLHDDQKRSRYDQFGHAATEPSFGAGGGGFTHGFDLSDALRAFMRDFGSFDDVFSSGGERGADASAARRGRNLQVRIKLTLEEVAQGVSKKIRLKRLGRCNTCDGSGARPGSSASTCPDCRGAGQIRHVQRSFLGQFMSVAPCRRCEGTGRVVTDPCTECRGEGRVETTETISVDVPKGVSEGNYIPIAGKGHAGLHRGGAGDLIILIEEEPHEIFERHGDDIVCDLPITVSTAALGGKVEVPTLTGSARLEIPKGTQSHKVFRLRGQGIPHLNSSSRGDQLVRVRVWTTKKLSAEERKALEALRAVESEPPKPARGLFESLRDAFGVLLALASIFLSTVASAQIIETRQGDANPMVSVFKSTLYGAGAGTLLGLAVELVDEDSNGEAAKGGFVAGTFFGFAYGLYHVATRPEPGSALLEGRDGGLALAMPRIDAWIREDRFALAAPHFDARARGGAPLPVRPSFDVRAEFFALNF
jgi:molecular chaperone DnaJ